MTAMTWTVATEEDPETGELILTLPQDFLFLNDWRPNDRLEYSVEQDQVIVRNKDADIRDKARQDPS